MWLSEEAVCCRGDTASGWRMKSRLFNPARLLWSCRGAPRSTEELSSAKQVENEGRTTGKDTFVSLAGAHSDTNYSRIYNSTFHKKRYKGILMKLSSVSPGRYFICHHVTPLLWTNTEPNHIRFGSVSGSWECGSVTLAEAFPMPCITCLFVNHHIHIQKFLKKWISWGVNKKALLLYLHCMLCSSSFSKENNSNCNLRWKELL